MKMLTGFKKEVAKIEGVTSEGTPPSYWTTSGNHVLNRILGGSFKKAAGQGRMVGLVGPSGCLPGDEEIIVYVMQTITYKAVVQQENDIVDLVIAPESYTLTTNNKITELLHYGVEVQEGASTQQIDDMFESQCCVLSFSMQIKQLSQYSDLHKLMLVSTPDGFQPIVQIFIKNSRPIYEIKVDRFTLRCSNDHLIQTCNGWATSEQLVVGDIVLTENGYQPLIGKELQQPEPVYDFEVGHENHRYWSKGISSHNSGKSYLLCNFMKEAQREQNAFVLALDSENALDDDFVEKIGVDTSPENYMYLSVITIPHIKKIVSKFIEGYKDSGETRPVFIAIDSLGMLLTDTEFDLLEKGDNKGDQGQRAKQLKSILRGFVQQIKSLNIQIFITDQVYAANQDAVRNGTADGNWVVNGAVKYSLSNILMITKLKLREGTAEFGEVIGVKMKCEAIKTRFTKPFQKVVIEVPYETGMDPCSGLKEVAFEMGIIRKKGAYVVIEKTQDQFYWKDLNNERIQVILNEAELMTNVSIGKSVEDEEEVIEGTEGSLKQKRLANYAKFKEQNPNYVPEGSGEDL